MIPDVVEQVAYQLIKLKKGSDPDESDEETYAGLSFLISNFSIVLCSLLIGLLSSNAIECVFALSAFWTSRMLTGGFHFKSLTGCVIASVFLFALIIHLDVPVHFFPFIMGVSLFILWLRREKECSKNLHSKLVVSGLVLTIAGVWIAPMSVALSLFVQALTLLKGGEKNEK